jgi:hypothetical protein
MLLAHDAHFGIHQMLRYIPKTRPKGLKPARHRSRSDEAGGQFGDILAGFHDFASQHMYHYAFGAKSLQLLVSLRFFNPRDDTYCIIWVKKRGISYTHFLPIKIPLDFCNRL